MFALLHLKCCAVGERGALGTRDKGAAGSGGQGQVPFYSVLYAGGGGFVLFRAGGERALGRNRLSNALRALDIRALESPL